jgi:hypothetical protein
MFIGSKYAIEQLQKSMKNFRKFFPEHADKKLFGILCALKAQERNIEKVIKMGFLYRRQEWLFQNS